MMSKLPLHILGALCDLAYVVEEGIARLCHVLFRLQQGMHTRRRCIGSGVRSAYWARYDQEQEVNAIRTRNNINDAIKQAKRGR